MWFPVLASNERKNAVFLLREVCCIVFQMHMHIIPYAYHVCACSHTVECVDSTITATKSRRRRRRRRARVHDSFICAGRNACECVVVVVVVGLTFFAILSRAAEPSKWYTNCWCDESARCRGDFYGFFVSRRNGDDDGWWTYNVEFIGSICEYINIPMACEEFCS